MNYTGYAYKLYMYMRKQTTLSIDYSKIGATGSCILFHLLLKFLFLTHHVWSFKSFVGLYCIRFNFMCILSVWKL